eukprot:TRINITY_DN6857_c0_g1_i1.p1 TRINITY_DN6857_c0_g1~~TRINITY_DN6857_c0_g1_i1.p1  ORF type:complete len:355 (-),score=67.09 TRINITY_DN6857_c0_g1_i1:122-1186(-)
MCIRDRDNIVDTPNGIGQKLAKHFSHQAYKAILPVLFSVNIIGNPVGLFRNISTGVKDLVEKPREGFEKGPLEGGYGVVVGASSLVRNTVSGTAGSIGKITDSLSRGISALSMDKKFMEDRERMSQQKAHGVREGLKQGARAMVSSVTKGVTGVITQPVEGGSEGGFKGFAKGTAKGLTGLVVKPVTGILDFASKTSEGIKNRASTKEATDERARLPRTFYGREQYFKDYVENDAALCYIMKKAKKGRFAECRFIEGFELHPDPTDSSNSFVLIIAYECVLLLNSKNQRVLWWFRTDNMAKVELVQNEMLVVTLREPTKKLPERRAVISTRDARLCAHIAEALNAIMDELMKAY